LRGFASRQCLDVGGCKRLSAHRPVAALYLVDEHPGELTQVLSLDAHHGICDSLNDGLLLLLREDPFDELDVDQWHWTLLSRRETPSCYLAPGYRVPLTVKISNPLVQVSLKNEEIMKFRISRHPFLQCLPGGLDPLLTLPLNGSRQYIGWNRPP